MEQVEIKQDEMKQDEIKQAGRGLYYDQALQVGAYYFKRLKKEFVNHFHEYYVFGLVEAGAAELSCGHGAYALERGQLFIFNPGDNHACLQCGSVPLEYRTLNIEKSVMLPLARELTGSAQLPVFAPTVLEDGELAQQFEALHQLFGQKSVEFEKEELLLFFLSQLLQRYSKPFQAQVPQYRAEVEQACQFLQRHYTQAVSLEQICRQVGLSKSTLLRAFVKAKGITPYRYLQTIRIGAAQALLQQGWAPVDAALQTGFSDQSHFTNYFQQMIGVSPGAYRDIFSKKQSKES